MQSLHGFMKKYSPEFAAEVKSKLFEAVCALSFVATPSLNLDSLGLYIHLHTLLLNPPVASTSDLRSTLSHLGLGKRCGIPSNAISLESEVDSYLALPVSFAESIIMYWWVCGSVSCTEYY